MKINNLTSVDYTRNIQGTVDFFVNTLGCECLKDKQKWGWAWIPHYNTNILISKLNEHIPFEKSILTNCYMQL